MKKITLLAASALLLLTACGQVESSPAEAVPPSATVAQEEVQQPQAAPKPATAVKEPDTVSGAAEEQDPEGKAPQTETASQATQTIEPVEELASAEDIPTETVHAKTGYVEPEPTPEPEPAPEPTAPADRQAAIDAANAYASTQYGVVTDSGLTLDNRCLPLPRCGACRCLARDIGSQGAGHGGLHLPPAHDAGGTGQRGRRRIPLQRLHCGGWREPPDLCPL